MLIAKITEWSKPSRGQSIVCGDTAIAAIAEPCNACRTDASCHVARALTTPRSKSFWHKAQFIAHHLRLIKQGPTPPGTVRASSM
jgi:hypothetical protein